MKRPAALWSVFLLGVACVGCHEDGTWKGDVDLWPIPRAGNDRIEGERDAGMDQGLIGRELLIAKQCQTDCKPGHEHG